jgi:hypothetical protein
MTLTAGTKSSALDKIVITGAWGARARTHFPPFLSQYSSVRFGIVIACR